ncbi:PHP domain-containing protein [Holdemania massiliensis]|uniref:PHP domain-containing protein n=1 Tax=Holdemania massiliensis TaxID=1468449 RepID=UPI001F0708A9|nr:PHP domain-containing protein [Holdemania massiliensis]MCH1940161.1 PHP domain-containing protein [Holdemania massiliensis]
MKADLHIHCSASFDATESIDTILELARENQLDLIAVSDHNEIDGALELERKGEAAGVETLSAIEIDCFFGSNIVHLLGYGCNLRDPGFTRLKNHYIEELRRTGRQRLQLIEEHYGLKLNEQAILERAKGRPYTNVEITQELLATQTHPSLVPYQSGERSANPIANFYWDQLAVGCWGYAELRLPEWKQVTDYVHQCGGALIVAHPMQNLKLDETAVEQLRQGGVDGFEVYSSYHDGRGRQFYHEVCQRWGLAETFGSDFHGTTKPNIVLGQTGYDGDCDAAVQILKERIAHWR